MTRLVDHLRSSWRILLKEVAAFGVVGAVGFVLQLGLFNLFHDIGSLKANALATVVTTAFAYVGNRYLSFSHRARTGLGRETSWFFGINFVTLVIAQLVLGVAYLFGKQQDKFVTNVLVVLGIGIGTIIRFWAYKRFVFLNPDKVSVVSGEVDAADRPVVDNPAA